jgi:RNA recognition motif-containing protein
VRIILYNNRPNGTALVRFATPQDAAAAAAAQHMQSLGGRYIEVFPCSREDVQRYMARSY